jgi:hypothetical protein
MKYLLGHVLCLFLIPSAKADGFSFQPNSVYVFGLSRIDSQSSSADIGPLVLFDSLDIGTGANYSFTLGLPLEGGIMGYGFSVSAGPDRPGGAIGSLVPGSVSVGGGCNGRASVIEYPPGFVFDPNKAPIDQWPFDLCNSPILAGASDPQLFKKVSANDFAFVPGTYGDGTFIVTGASVPEPATLTFLLAGFGALALRKRLARRD